MNYKKRFDPSLSSATTPGLAPAGVDLAHSLPSAGAVGDLRDGRIYVFEGDEGDEIVLAVNVALVTGRPLLLRGSPGSGKSSLAAYVARHMGYRYYEAVVTSRLQAQDLLWQFDAVRRLGDAQTDRLHTNQTAYVEPGVLWWAMNPKTAAWRGAAPKEVPQARDPRVVLGREPSDAPAVVLIDEIDKADPDVPNDLLVALGSFQFVVTETQAAVRVEQMPLVIITSNGERDLPAAFLRRCLVLDLKPPTKERLIRIADCHFPNANDTDKKVFRLVAEKVLELDQAAQKKRQRRPSTPEFLDTLRACRNLEISVGTGYKEWEPLLMLSLLKEGRGDAE